MLISKKKVKVVVQCSNLSGNWKTIPTLWEANNSDGPIGFPLSSYFWMQIEPDVGFDRPAKSWEIKLST
jgi:hypothetical protein